MAQPLSPEPSPPAAPGRARAASPPPARRALTLGASEEARPFKLTYYDFPAETEHPSTERDRVMSASCQLIAEVPKAFHDTLCVQGSGRLANGQTVSFAKRDCDCASTCPRTGAKICFEALAPAQFPWGRGAGGQAILPLRTVAADGDLLPLGTWVYVSVFDGLPLGEGKSHDGCFQVQDRGSRVKGDHLDVFTGDQAGTARFREAVPKEGTADVITHASRCPGGGLGP